MTSLSDISISPELLKIMPRSRPNYIKPTRLKPIVQEPVAEKPPPIIDPGEEFDEMIQRIEERFPKKNPRESTLQKTKTQQNSSSFNIFNIFRASIFSIATFLIPLFTCALLSSINVITINYLQTLYAERGSGTGADPVMVCAIVLSTIEILRCYLNLNFRQEFKLSGWKEFLITFILSTLNSIGLAVMVYRVFPSIDSSSVAVNSTRYIFLLPTTLTQSIFQTIFPTKNKKFLQILSGIAAVLANLGFTGLYITKPMFDGQDFDASKLYQVLCVAFIGIQYLPNFWPDSRMFLKISKNIEHHKNALGVVHEIANILVFIVISSLNPDVLRKGADSEMFFFIACVIGISFLANIFIGILLGADRRKTFYFVTVIFVPIVSSGWIYLQDDFDKNNLEMSEIICLAVGLILGVMSLAFGSLYLLINDYGKNMSDDALFFTYSRYSTFLNISSNYVRNVRKFFVTAIDYEKLDSRGKQNTEVPVQNEQEKLSENIVPPHIYVCPTFYKEDAKEMKTICRSLIRMNDSNYNHTNYTFETHIWFDNVMDLAAGVNNHVGELNQWVHDLVKVLAGRGFKLENYVQCPYGIRLEYKFPKSKNEAHRDVEKGTPLFVHLKDQRKIQRGKRWSQCCYMYYFIVHKLGYSAATAAEHKQTISKLDNQFILALDADIDFKAKELNAALSKARSDPNIGITCGQIVPTGEGWIVLYQKFEYAVGHWLQKSAENVLGSVLCSPGCFSLIKCVTMVSNREGAASSCAQMYTSRAETGKHKVQWNLGEDRWLCTLAIKNGWNIEYEAISTSRTACPDNLKDFFIQRRRWAPSTVLNVLEVALFDSEYFVKRNKIIKNSFVWYLLLTQLASFLGPSTILLLVIGSFSQVFPAVPHLISTVLMILPVLIFTIVAINGHPDKKENEKLQIKLAEYFHFIYYIVMWLVTCSLIFGLFGNPDGMVCGLCNPSNQFFLVLMFMYLSSAIMHPGGLGTMAYFPIYLAYMPTMFIFLQIFAFAGMDNLSWGTREGGGGSGGDSKRLYKHPLISTGLDQICKCQLCFVNQKEFYGIDDKPSERKSVDTKKKTVPKKPLPYNKHMFKENYSEIANTTKVRKTARGTVRRTVRTSNQDNLSEVPVNCSREEELFWKELIKAYLFPEDRAEEEDQNGNIKINEKAVKLKTKTNILIKAVRKLRNNYLSLLLIMNTVWLTINLAVKYSYDVVSIKTKGVFCQDLSQCPKVEIQPFSFLFLIFYFLVMSLQWLCMVKHRIGSFVSLWIDDEFSSANGGADYEVASDGEESSDDEEEEDDDEEEGDDKYFGNSGNNLKIPLNAGFSDFNGMDRYNSTHSGLNETARNNAILGGSSSILGSHNSGYDDDFDNRHYNTRPSDYHSNNRPKTAPEYSYSTSDTLPRRRQSDFEPLNGPIHEQPVTSNIQSYSTPSATSSRFLKTPMRKSLNENSGALLEPVTSYASGNIGKITGLPTIGQQLVSQQANKPYENQQPKAPQRRDSSFNFRQPTNVNLKQSEKEFMA